MRITRIDFEGREGIFAIAKRQRDAKQIEVEILQPTMQASHWVDAGDEDELFAMAVFLQELLDGYQGTMQEAACYYNPLLCMSDIGI
jgi:hypothetical protein|tara:strand:+ start:414 stop:674 length:261 start_codon:yes stop_codon:yes gene_type:complete